MLQVVAYTGGEQSENCYLLRDVATGAAALIDPGFDSPDLRAAVEAETISLILLTHGHYDHIGGVEAFCKGAQVMALQDEAALLRDSELNLSAWVCPDRLLSVTPDHFLQDGDTVQLGETILTVLATPGHTAGGCCYYTPGWLFSGDTLMASTVGRTDFPTGDSRDLAVSLKKLAKLPDETALCSGHGPLSSLAREKETNFYLRSF